MTRKKIFLCLILVLCMSLLLCGCGSKDGEQGDADKIIGLPAIGGPKPGVFSAGEFDPETTSELAIVLHPGETELLAQLPALSSADFSGSECVEEIYNWAAQNPQVAVKYTVSLPGGTVLDNSAKSLDLSALSGVDVSVAADMLRFLPELESIELGYERDGLGWDAVSKLEQNAPNAAINYVFTLYGYEFSLQDTEINLSHVPVEDNGAAVMEAMAYMPKLSSLDMDSCGVSNEDMAAIRDAYPDVKVVWRIWFGDNYSVRTDVERILASAPSKGGMLTGDNTDVLKYCTEVKYLDMGHNDELWDIDFVAYMPKLEVAVLAMACWSDASPLANCKNLEYLEIQTTNVTDLSPLSGLENLRHLNIAYNRELSDISPLYSLTGLERLWIGCINPVPPEQIEAMQAAAPNCEINVEVYEDPTGGRWRYVDYNELAYMYIYHDRYIQLRETFGDYASECFSFYWNDPLY